MTYYGGQDLARSFRTVRGNTLTVARDIPEERYGFRPTPDSRSVGELLAHIAISSRSNLDAHAIRKITTMVGVNFFELARQREEQEKQPRTKAGLLEMLRADGEAWGTYLEQASEQTLAELITFPEPVEPRTKTRFEMILGVKEHEMHHRAQLMLIERLLGIVPHLTRERKARAADAASR